MARFTRIVALRPGLLGFKGLPGVEAQVVQIVIPTPFQAQGLMLWGVDESTTVDITVGDQKFSLTELPALAFTSNLDFEELRKGVEGIEPHKAKEVSEKVLKVLEDSTPFKYFGPMLFDEQSLLKLEFKGPISHGLFWGKRAFVEKGRLPYGGIET